MTDAGPRRYHFPWFCVAFTLFDQAANSNWIGGHLDHAICPMPFTPGTVAIKLKTIVIGIRDIQRFAHQVISLTNLQTGSGADGSGGYSEISFNFQTDAAWHASIRSYHERPAVLFVMSGARLNPRRVKPKRT